MQNLGRIKQVYESQREAVYLRLTLQFKRILELQDETMEDLQAIRDLESVPETLQRFRWWAIWARALDGEHSAFVL